MEIDDKTQLSPGRKKNGCSPVKSRRLTRIVLFVETVGAADGHVIGAPGELLDVGTVVGQRHRAAVEANVLLVDVRNELEILLQAREKTKHIFFYKLRVSSLFTTLCFLAEQFVTDLCRFDSLISGGFHSFQILVDFKGFHLL